MSGTYIFKEWIDYKNFKPQIGDHCIFIDNQGKMILGFYYDKFFLSNDYLEKHEFIKCWMISPEFPKDLK